MLRRPFLRLLLAATLPLAGLVACSPPAPKLHFRSVDITGANYGKDFRLTDFDGRVRTLADYRGKVVTLFFGYLHCPDFCPTNLVRQNEVMRLLGPDAARVQTLFVTVDPERDDAATLKSYITAFNPGFVGLRGSPQEIAVAAKDFHAFYQKVKQKDSALGYSMDHSTTTLVFDQQGRLRLGVKHAQPAAEVAADLRLLIKNGAG